MPDKLTWDEIKKRYPNEYVVLVDVDGDDRSVVVRAGVVFAHSVDCKKLLRETKEPLAGMSRTLRFTGDVGKGNYLF